MSITALGLDPSFLATGWSIILLNKRPKLVASGWITTSRDKSVQVTVDDIVRARKIVIEIDKLISTYNPDIICTEIPLGSQSAAAAKSLGIVKGIVTSVCTLRDIKTRYINPLAVKIAVCSNKNAEKSDIIFAVEQTIPSIKKLKNRTDRNNKFTLKHEAICDSVAVTLSTMLLDGKYKEYPASDHQAE